MPRGSADKNYFQFTQGKITEASPLTFPENSMKDELNIDINFDGTIQRRLGVDYEAAYVNVPASIMGGMASAQNVTIQSYIWENVGGLDITPVLVIRYGSYLLFYDAYSEPLSEARIANIVSLYSTGLMHDQPVSFAEAKGRLFVAGNNFDPCYISFDTQSNQFTKTSITIQIRDTEGVDDGLRDNERPKNLTGPHMYNLINQGWPYKNVGWKYQSSSNREHGLNQDSVRTFRTIAGETQGGGVSAYPSNSDIYMDYVSGEYMISRLVGMTYDRSGAAPKGKVVINAFNENRKSLAAEYSSKGGSVTPWLGAGFVEKSTTARPSAMTFFQGHILYSGVNDADYNDKIYVSQSLVGLDRAGKCYAVNDPTADIESSPLDTDGGVIRIEGVDRIIALVPMGPHCLVIANNGVWSLSSDPEIFSVNSVSVSKLTNVGALGSMGIAVYETNTFFWSEYGIYAVTRDPQYNTLSVTNITEFTIQSDYTTIPQDKKALAHSVVDVEGRKIYWLYNKDPQEELTNKMVDVLIFDARTNAFYDYKIASGFQVPFVTTGFFKPAISTDSETDNVVVNGDQVQVNGDDVIVTTSFQVSSASGNLLKLFTLTDIDGAYFLTFSEFRNRNFVDWEQWDSTGIDYDSYIETGYELLGDTMRNKQTTYIFCYFDRTEESFILDEDSIVFDYPSSCYMQTKWNWAESGHANRWTEPQQVYRFKRPFVPSLGPFNYDFVVIETKNKVRGKGKAVSIRFMSEPGKDFRLLGWAINFTAGAAP